MRQRAVGAQAVDRRRAQPKLLRRFAHRQEPVASAMKDRQASRLFG
jgi:hypothetical protein